MSETLGNNQSHAGLDLFIENRPGTVRSGFTESGRPFFTLMRDSYGHIKGTTGADGEELDVYVGPCPEDGEAYVVYQLREGTGEFDEHKVMLGYPSESAAKEAFQHHIDNPDMFWKIEPIDVSDIMMKVEHKNHPQKDTPMPQDKITELHFSAVKMAEFAADGLKDHQRINPEDFEKHGADTHALTEMELHSQTHYPAYQHHQAVSKTHLKHLGSDSYDHGKAEKLWGHHADHVSKSYSKEYGSGSGHAFDKQTRGHFSKMMANRMHPDYIKGEGGKNDHEHHMDDLPKTTQAGLKKKLGW